MSLKKKYTFEERLPLFLAFIIPILIMVGVFAGKSIYPFGDQSFLRTDMYHQYAPFFMDFLEKLKKGESLTYAWEIGLGSNYVALIAYYLSSPFNLLLLILPSSLIIEFMTYLIVLKIGLCGLTMSWYLGKRHNTRHMGIAFFGICYALSGYLAAYSWNIMWLDCLWLAPLIFLGLERLVKEDKPFLYCITLGLAIFTNYYISIMLCIFMVLYFVCLMIMLPKQPFSRYLVKFGRFTLYSLIAGGLGAVLLIPAAYALMGTASANSTFPTTMTSYFSIFDMLARHLVDVEVEIGLDHWPNLYCGVASLLFLPMYYLNRRVPYKEKIVKTTLLFLLLLSFSLNIPNYIWHGMHYPNSLPCRQSFLYNILLLSMCFEGYKGFKGMTKGKLLACFWGLVAFILLAEKLVDANQNIAYHTYYVSLLFIALYTLLLYLYKTRRLQMTTAFILSMGVLVLELGLNTAVTSVTITSRSDYWKNTEDYSALLETVEGDVPFYRAEKVHRKTKNDGAWAGFRSASIFSSTTHAGVSDLYRKLGLEGNTNAYSFTGATPFTASILSVRYLFDTSALEDSEVYHFRESTEGGVHFYENDYTLPLGFMIPSNTEELWDTSSGNPARVQNSLVQLTTGVGDILTPLTGSTSGSEFTSSVSEHSHVFVFVENGNVDNVTATIGERQEVFSNVKRRYLLDLGYCNPDETITLTTRDEESLSATAYAFNDERFIEAYQVLNSQPLEITELTDTITRTAVNGQVTATEDGLLFTSIPYDKGWIVKVDGVTTTAENFADTFLAIPVTAGTHTIELNYFPEGLKEGALISSGSLLLLLICFLIFVLLRKRKSTREKERLEKTAAITETAVKTATGTVVPEKAMVKEEASEKCAPERSSPENDSLENNSPEKGSPEKGSPENDSLEIDLPGGQSAVEEEKPTSTGNTASVDLDFEPISTYQALSRTLTEMEELLETADSPSEREKPADVNKDRPDTKIAEEPAIILEKVPTEAAIAAQKVSVPAKNRAALEQILSELEEKHK